MTESRWSKWAESYGIDLRAARALLRTFILNDLRGQHFAQATGQKLGQAITPLFWVVGQCLTLSAVVALVLFARVDVFIYAFAGLTVSVILMTTLLLVEFHEVILDPKDRIILGHRPVSPRTYAVARFGNLLFFLILIGLSANLLFAIVGLGLRDTTWLYFPAYCLCVFTSSSVIVAGVVTLHGTRSSGASWKDLLAWTQIILILVAGYGAQLLLRKGGVGIQLWASQPPPWLEYIPTTWLAHFVDRVCDQPGIAEVWQALGLLGLGVLATGYVVWRVGRLYARVQPEVVNSRERIYPAHLLGSLGFFLPRLFTRPGAERAGFWLTVRMLRKEGGFLARCSLPLAAPMAVVILGIATHQFAKPDLQGDPGQIILPLLATSLLVLAIPPMIYQLGFSKEPAAGWIWQVAHHDRKNQAIYGAIKGYLVILIAPLALIYGAVLFWVWHDLWAAVGQVIWIGMLSWPICQASIIWVLPGALFSRPLVRGAGVAPAPIPILMIGMVVLTLSTAQSLWTYSPIFWGISGILTLITIPRLAKLSLNRLQSLSQQGTS